MTTEQRVDRGPNHLASLASLVAIAAAIVAAVVIRVVLTEPMRIAKAVDTGDNLALLRQLADVIVKTLASLLDYL
jgi:hypothetical protein